MVTATLARSLSLLSYSIITPGELLSIKKCDITKPFLATGPDHHQVTTGPPPDHHHRTRSRKRPFQATVSIASIARSTGPDYASGRFNQAYVSCDAMTGGGDRVRVGLDISIGSPTLPKNAQMAKVLDSPPPNDTSVHEQSS